MSDKPDDTLEGLDLEAGLEAAFHQDDEQSSPGDQSVLAQLHEAGSKLAPVLLKDPDADGEHTPVVRASKGARRQGRYQVLGKIARGGVGVVLRGHDVDLGRDVAMKVIREEYEETPEVIQRFVEEAQIGGQLQHPGIVPVYEIGLGRNKRPYFTMKLIKGRTLSALLDERGTSTTPRLLSIFESVCQTMAYAHARGVIHRDLKPSNIMVGAYGEVLVVDWGMGKVLRQGGIDDERAARKRADQTVVTTLRSEDEGSQSVVGSVMGTPRYMSPEQARGDIERVDERSDVFGLGAILCEILTGQPPYTGTGNDVFGQAAMAKLDDAYERLDGCEADDELVSIAKRCMGPAPEARYANAAALASAVGDHISAADERIEQAKLAAVRAEERAEADRAAAEAARELARQEQEAANQARRARRLTMALAAVAVIVVALGAGLWLYAEGAAAREREETAQAVAAHLDDARRSFDAGDLDRAAESVARAQERDPYAAAPLAFRERIAAAREDEERDADLAVAGNARAEARQKMQEYEAVEESLHGMAQRLTAEHKTTYAQYAEEDERAAFADRVREFEEARVRVHSLLAVAREAVDRAGCIEQKWGLVNTDTATLLADVHVLQWRAARKPRGEGNSQMDDTYDAEGDLALASAFRGAAMRADTAGRYRGELLGRGSLTITVQPADAEVRLFRYESYETVRTDRPVIPRLVPTPTTGIGRVAVEGFAPGDPCFVVEAVAEGSPAARAGLKPGDLVLSVNGVACDSGATIATVAPDSRAEKAGLRPWVRIDRANGEDSFHWRLSRVLWNRAAQLKQPRSLEAGGIRVEAPAGEMLGISHLPTAELLGEIPNARRVQCLKDGRPLVLELAEGEASGITPRVTAYPLVLADANRVVPAQRIEADPGSYLVHVRREGHEPQRYSVVVPRGGDASANIVLNRAGTSPKGFVYIPPGPFVYGDRKAFRAHRRITLKTGGYWIQAAPLTFREYLEFLNDPEIRKRIDASGKEYDLVPREHRDGAFQPLVRKNEDGEYTTGNFLPDTPAFAISIRDARAYIEWRNRKAKEDGEPWVYDLPTEEEFEKAARGADGRAFSWGPRYDATLCVNRHRVKDLPLYWAPIRFESRDESPFGLADVVGARTEFVNSIDRSGLEEGSTERGFVNRGGDWAHPGSAGARLASRPWSDDGNTVGFRLVAKPR
jgi:formylglycine-generating enzyme required for sulfatase activity/tRNA A-37 threonylcarbamoyl transferase component Bud32